MHVNSTPIYFVYVKIIMYIIMSSYFVCVAIDYNIDSSSTTISYLYGNSYPARTAAVLLLGPALDFHPQLVAFFCLVRLISSIYIFKYNPSSND